MFLPELGKQIQGERHITSNNRVIRISAGSNNRESTVVYIENQNRNLTLATMVGQRRKYFTFEMEKVPIQATF